MNDIIRRKVARAAAAGSDGGPGADQGWRLAFARAARDGTGLLVEVAAMTLHRRSLAELLELPPDRALMVLLDGPQGGLGLMVMSPEVMGALIEMQTTARVSAAPTLTRRPTRTDAAMVAGVIDRALEELEVVLAEEADLVWAGGFRYASFLEDPRPLGLLLEDQPYRVLSADLSMASGARSGGLILALPAEGRGQRPQPKPGRDRAPAAAPGFSTALSEAVMAAGCTLEAVIARLTQPLGAVMALQVGQVLPLQNAALDRISLESVDGRQLACARLGQQKGMRALRLSRPAAGGHGGAAESGSAAVPDAPGPAAGGAGAPDTGFPSQAGLPPALLGPAAVAGAEDPFAGFAAPLDLGGGLLATG
ncbi:MAG: FliM/FliN family flagellar motor switch protein [Rhodobacter sp.]|mgnify:CR=1 FL=1|jgi:flagellar motor switch protein FliM|nr:FliM/FliN family flagellar motor switch protein [Rhodobacter sp.]MBK8441497.1 FliM/FliN family flagellar motor switch protein [Rhodobacter sp.]